MKPPEHKRRFAKKSLGQNFLTDPGYIDKIVGAVTPSGRDTIIEIGPGRGALTGRLVDSGASVVAIELDRELVPVLRMKFAERSNFRIVEQDALESDLSELLGCDQRPNGAGGTAKTSAASASRTVSAKLVANLPYYISTAILQRVSDQRHLFSEMVLMFQREVVERITAKPGNSERGFLTIIVEACFDVETLFDVPPEAFRPAPKVWSSVVRLIPKPKGNNDEAAFRNIVSTAFAQKRKTILNNLRTSCNDAEGCLGRSGIDPKRRAESLTLDEWVTLTGWISAAKPRN